MTIVKLHGILGKEYGHTFKLNIGNPKHILQAIDCNRKGFMKRLVDLQSNGQGYEIIVNKKRTSEPSEIELHKKPERIDLVPVIVGSSGLELVLIEKLFFAIVFATISYALTPKPEVDALEIQAGANTQSLIFSNRVNVASQGSPVPIGYGRLKVGTQVIQATIKSFPQSTDPNSILVDKNYKGEVSINTNRIQDSRPRFIE